MLVSLFQRRYNLGHIENLISLNNQGISLTVLQRREKGTTPNRQLRKRAHAGSLPDSLPLVHVTAVGIAREIVQAKKLETRPCPVFKKDLLYFFALRPAYRLKEGDAKQHQINRFPFVFILNPTAVLNPYHVYPFDTGGAANGIFDAQADPFVYLEDFELDPTHAAVVGQIGWAFGGLDEYYEGALRENILDDVPTFETVTRGYVDIARHARSGSNQPDKRASAIEVASDHDVNLKDNIQLAILPKQYLEDSTAKNEEFIKALEAEGIAWEVYDWQPNIAPNEFQEEIARIAKAWFKKNGHM